MKCSASALAVVALLAAPGLAWTDAGDCLAIWVDTQGQPAECAAVRLVEELDHQPDVCPAEKADKAAVRVKMTSCVEAPSHIIRARASEGMASKELTGRDDASWAGAVRELCRAVVAWHFGRDEPRR